MIQGGIYFRWSASGRKFDSILETRWNWFAIFHVKEINKITRILRLRKEKYFFGLQNLDKKIMQMCYGYHFKFLLSFFLRLDFTWIKRLWSLLVRKRLSTLKTRMVRWFLTLLADIGVKMASRKANVKEKAILFGIRSSRNLLNAIYNFLRWQRREKSLWT